MIEKFENENFFLSNYFPCKVTYNGLTYGSSEAAYQAQKCPERAKEFTALDPDDSKKLGRKVKIRYDWEAVKEQIMTEIVHAKFTQNKDLGKRLTETGEEELVEGNWWKDTYWGVCDGVGQNKLGKILMAIRGTLKS